MRTFQEHRSEMDKLAKKNERFFKFVTVLMAIIWVMVLAGVITISVGAAWFGYYILNSPNFQKLLGY